MSAWIGVNDRLPPEGVLVLVASRDGLRIACLTRAHPEQPDPGRRSWYVSSRPGGVSEVTHWQDLPDLPEPAP
jgi:hypothetical protein